MTSSAPSSCDVPAAARDAGARPDSFRQALRRLRAIGSAVLAPFALLTIARAAAPDPRCEVMPMPADVQFATGRLPVTTHWSVAISGADTPRLREAIERGLTRWEQRTGLTFPHTSAGAYAFAAAPLEASLVVEAGGRGPDVPALGDDEAYALEVTPNGARLQARTDTGALRGLETLWQLLQADGEGWFVPALKVQDEPRFPWRGLMIDVCRHWQPVDVIKRNLDGMALVKLNVLHLHLTDDQGFRIESRKIPRLQQLGSDGHFFTQEQMRDLIAYAAARGIRVVPEFDIPGHATSWVVAYPELASAPGPYVIERSWGVFDPVLDPTNEQTYALLDTFLGEMAALFPDPYLHIGGDENNGVQWNANPRIQAFIREHGLKDNAGLHAYFNRRVRDILRKYGKKLVGWDEVLHPDLPKDSIVQSWRGASGLAEAVGQGYAAILSNGYYIDLCHSAADHYANDPIPADTKLTPEEQRRIFGGEATMWSEWVTPETIDSRIWPRTAAIAERLWSPRAVDDVGDMYRRLALVNRRLEESGLAQDRNRPAMLRRFAGDGATPETLRNLAVLVDAVEPVKNYRRGQQQPGSTQFTPLTGIADCARPESNAAREFSDGVRSLVFAPSGTQANRPAAIAAALNEWQESARYLQAHAMPAPRVTAEAVPVASALAQVCAVGLDALQRRSTAGDLPTGWKDRAFAALDEAAKQRGAVLLPMVPSVRLLVAATVLEPDRARLTPAEWQREVERLASPPAPPDRH